MKRFKTLNSGLRHHFGSLGRGLHLCIGAHPLRAFLAWPVLWVLTISFAMISASFPAAEEGWLVNSILWVKEWYFMVHLNLVYV